MPRTMIADLKSHEPQTYQLKGWIRRIRETKSNIFIVLQDCSGTILVLAEPVRNKHMGLRAESAVAITGTVRRDERAPGGIEFSSRNHVIWLTAARIRRLTSTLRT